MVYMTSQAQLLLAEKQIEVSAFSDPSAQIITLRFVAQPLCRAGGVQVQIELVSMRDHFGQIPVC